MLQQTVASFRISRKVVSGSFSSSACPRGGAEEDLTPWLGTRITRRGSHPSVKLKDAGEDF